MENKLALVSNNQLLKAYSLSNCLTRYGKLDVSKCLESKSPSLGTLIREKKEKFTVSLVMLWLVSLNELLDLKNPMSEAQIRLTAQTICQQYSNFKIADLTYLFKGIIEGKYGEFYERLSITKIISIFRNYNEERSNFAGEMSRRKNEQFKQARETKTNDSFYEFLRTVGK